MLVKESCTQKEDCSMSYTEGHPPSTLAGRQIRAMYYIHLVSSDTVLNDEHFSVRQMFFCVFKAVFKAVEKFLTRRTWAYQVCFVFVCL